MDNLEKYVLNHSSCVMPRCEYVENGINISCDECQRRMLTEHDTKVRADAIEEVWKLSKEQSVVDAMGIRCIDLSVLDLILEQLKEQK